MTDAASLRPSDRQVLAMLRRHGDLRRSHLVRLSGLPRSTISDAAARLQHLGLVVERPMPAAARTGAGRPPMLLSLAASPGLAGTIVLTQGTLTAAAVGLDGTLHARHATDAYAHDLADGIAEPGLALLDAALHDLSLGREALACAVVGLPLPVIPGRGLATPPVSGPADRKRPRMRPPSLPAWAHTDPSIDISQQLGVPTWFENDANLAALGEGSLGAATGMASFIYIKMVHGIGAGLIIDGRLHRGAHGLAGELAHIHVQDQGYLCRCGSRGCLITVLNTPQLVDLIAAVNPAATTMADVLRLVAASDAGVTRLLRDLGRTIGRSLADFCVYLAPDGIVLDGNLQNASEPVIDGISEMLHQFTPPAIVSQVSLVGGALEDRAELLGAAMLARRNRLGLDSTPGEVAS
jgi:predicted NBD/HSP70 family sugar kinase